MCHARYVARVFCVGFLLTPPLPLCDGLDRHYTYFYWYNFCTRQKICQKILSKYKAAPRQATPQSTTKAQLTTPLHILGSNDAYTMHVSHHITQCLGRQKIIFWFSSYFDEQSRTVE